MKGIILAGGTGSRLYPLNQVVSKQLQPVFDKPMIYYPLTVLMAAGIRELCVIVAPADLEKFRLLLRDGSQWGISIAYLTQQHPNGIAEAFVIAAEFIGGAPVACMLGDNLFFGGDAFPRAVAAFKAGATVFAYHVNEPQDYAVVEFDSEGRAVSLEEKPDQPRSKYAVPGVYLYDSSVVEIAKALRRSSRGEYEITDINRIYLKQGRLNVVRLSRGFAWHDAGTSTRLHDASVYVQTIEKRQGMKLGCPEEAGLRRGFIGLDEFDSLLAEMPNCEYRAYLCGVAREARRHGLASA